MSFIAGAVFGGLAAYAACYWLYRGMQADDRWWQGNEGRRDARWPVLPVERPVVPTSHRAVMLGAVEVDEDGNRTLVIDRAYELAPATAWLRLRRCVHVALFGWSS